MKSKSGIISALALTSALSAFAVTSYAADSEGRPVGFYIGGHYGQFKADGEEFDDDNDYFGGVIGGLINPYIGVEAAYEDFGEFGGNLASADLHGYSIAGLLRLPIGKSFGIYAKGGQLFWKSDVEALGFKEDIDGDEPFYGIGADYFFGEHFNVGVEYLRYNVDLNDSSLPDLVDDYETDIDTAQVSLKFFF